jgi:hypothetical protein
MAEGLQRGAKDFVEDFYNNFGDLLDYIPYKSAEVSLPLEAFLRFNVEADREIFSAVKFEDVVYGGEKSINLKSLIEMATEWLPNYLEL